MTVVAAPILAYADAAAAQLLAPASDVGHVRATAPVMRTP